MRHEMKRQELITEIETILYKQKEEMSLPEEYREQLKILFSDSNVLDVCRKVLDRDYINKLNYEQLKEIADTLNSATGKLNRVSEEIDITLFLKGGYRLDLEGLRKQFDEQGLKEQYPNIDLKVLTDFYEHPPKYIYPYYNETLRIYVNPVIFRKFVLAILQMVFNEMDLLLAYTGSEGVGKSTLCSQHILLIHIILKEANITNYDYKIKDMMFNSLASLRNAEDDHFSEKFRQFALDEGNELHRQNWKEAEVQTFFQRLRRERYNQRIKYICIPVIGELMTNIIMTRINFIFEVYSENKNKLGILKKGEGNFYILPRGNKIYSYERKKELTRDFIKATLYENLKDKAYLKGIPKELIIQKFTFNGVHGFNKAEYNKELKETNKSFSVKEGIKLNNTTLYILYKISFTHLRPKRVGLKSNTPEYASYHKFLQTVRNYFIENPRAKKVEEEKFSLKYG